MDAKETSRNATSPSDYSWTAWKRIIARFKTEFSEDRVTFTAASVAFYIVLGIVPLLSAFVGIFGLFSTPENVTLIAGHLEGAVPPEALSIIRDQLSDLSTRKASAGLNSFFSILIALWSGSKAMDGLITATNLAYSEKEQRGFIKRKSLGIGLTTGTLLVIIVAASLLIYAGNQKGAIYTFLTLLKWPGIFVVIALWISVLYRFAPSRSQAKWRWISHGALLATTLWIVTSFLFSIYASNFGKYNETYGSLGAVVVLLLWLYLSSISIIVGARINAQLELETIEDTTKGETSPVGERGAHVANNCAED